MKTIADFMGDTEETIKKNYLHLSPDYLRSAINRQKQLRSTPPKSCVNYASCVVDVLYSPLQSTFEMAENMQNVA